MRDAVAAQAKFVRSYSKEIFGSLEPLEQQVLSYRYGGQDGAIRKVIRNHIASLKTGMELDPAKTYHNIFTSQG